MKKILFFLNLAAVGLLTSCATPPEATPPAPAGFDTTIANLARVVESPAVAVRGYGIVAGLYGTGSAECPPELRGELEKYIWQQLPQAGTINPRRFIESLDTAVVEVLGVIPPMAAAGQGFDIIVRPLSGTQTTSLNGGHLYTTDLKEMSRFTQFNQYAKTVARAQGPIFTDRSSVSDTPSWFVLGGGYPLSDVTISLMLNPPDYLAAGAIRNRINERFGPKASNAVSAGEVLLFIPEAYRHDKPRFSAMIRQLYLADQAVLRQRHIDTLIGQLKTAEDKFIAEISLEAIGKLAVDDLSPLLKSEDAAVRFHAARCLSNIGDGRSLPVLREFVFDPQSPYRRDAIRTIGRNARLSDAEPILLRALSEDSMELRLAAYETALAAKSASIQRTLVAKDFYVDRVLCDGPKVIYALRKDRPGVILFGSPLRCKDNIFLRSDDGEVTLNARPGDKHIAVSRTHPGRPRIVGPLASGFEITQLIRALAESPEQQQGTTALPGLALPYCQIIQVLEKLCKTEAVDARYEQSPLTTAGDAFQN